MVTFAGVVNWAELSDSDTTVPPADALLIVAVQVKVWLPDSGAPPQLRPVRSGEFPNVRLADLIPPFRLAVRVTVSSPATPVTFAVN